MAPRVDLRVARPTENRDRVTDTLDSLSMSDTLEIVSDEDPAVYLHQYRISHDQRDLEWMYDTSGPETWEVSVRIVEPAESLPVFDVRDLRPQRRHEVLLESFDALSPGQGFVFVNDHDPKPLGHELRSTRGDTFDWTYREKAAGEWRVAIEKTAPSSGPDDDVTTQFDVREISQDERHETIHHRYGMLPDGATMEIVAPHNPQHLRNEFETQYGDTFSWDVLEEEPECVRVRVRKGSDADTDHSGSGESDSAVTVTAELDVRDRPPAQRHEAIFETYADLELGEGFILVNDHDPKPLYHQFDAEAGDVFHWAYQLKEPGEFRVLIAKTTTDTPDRVGQSDPDPPF